MAHKFDGGGADLVAGSEETWFLAQLKPGGFDRARVNLKRQCVTSFMPVKLVSARRNNRLHEQLKPLFPGYLFVRFDPVSISFSTVNSTFGISRLVMRDGQSAQTVPVRLISDLKNRCDEDNTLLPPATFKPGEKVRILSGPFARFVAEIESMAEPERAWALLDMLGRTVRAKVATSDLEMVNVA